MLHYKTSTKPYVSSSGKSPAEVLIKELEKINQFTHYSKGKAAYFDVIIGCMDTAIKNSKELLSSGKEFAQDERDINPSTYMHRLVEILMEINTSQN